MAQNGISSAMKALIDATNDEIRPIRHPNDARIRIHELRLLRGAITKQLKPMGEEIKILEMLMYFDNPGVLITRIDEIARKYAFYQ